MGRETKRLSARTVGSIRVAGMYADGDGLYLRVDAAGSKRWTFIYFGPHPTEPGKTKRTEMGLGNPDDFFNSLLEVKELPMCKGAFRGV